MARILGQKINPFIQEHLFVEYLEDKSVRPGLDRLLKIAPPPGLQRAPPENFYNQLKLFYFWK